MRRLRPTDGTLVHRRAAMYHVTRCRSVNEAQHKQIADDMQALYARLVKESRTVEDADDAATAATATADARELALENTIRDTDAELAHIDRIDPSQAAQATVFPRGFGEVIDPENDAQLEALPPVHRALKPYRSHASVDTLAQRLESDETLLRQGLEAVEAADEQVDAAFADENNARRAIREQMEVAYGKLRAFYKSRPAQAERFFLREGNRRPSTAKKNQPR